MSGKTKLVMLIINKYHKRPFPKILLENIRYWIRYYKLYYKNNKVIKTAVFYPQYPSKRSVLYKIFGILNYNRTNNPNTQFDIVINWQDTTFQKKYNILNELKNKYKVINYHCTDISKKYVDKIHRKIFGYNTTIDPKTYRGKAVKKSDYNAQHDGHIIECPVKTIDKDFIYQKLIDNKFDNTMVEDIRTPIFNGYIPLVYLKYKPLDKRFGSFLTGHYAIKDTSIRQPEEVYTKDEISHINNFSKAIGLDYGELDILRDRQDGKIYIIDVNNTPTGPSHLSKAVKEKVLNTLSETFKKAFLES